LTIRTYIEDLMYGRKRAFFIEGLLLPVSFCYGIAVRMRHALYALRIFRKKRLPCRVISVGNITLGGTGKTPTVIQIADFLLKNKRYPAVVSRGYGRKNEADIVAVSDGKAQLSDIAIAGDEASLIGSKLPGLPVVVGSDRYGAALFALQVFGPNAIILDDGFQHVRLRRDLDIVLVDAEDPFGNGRLFPSGILREPLKSLERAHVVLITRADKAVDIEALKTVIRRKTDAKIFTSRHSPIDLVDIRNSETRPFSSLRGATILAFSGIARPASFSALLRSLGADIRYEMVYPDHYVYKRADMAAIFQKAGDARATMIITTEKDAVRLKTLNPDGIWALRIELRVVETGEWEKIILEA
jgi:tetraacyldisaccharide 4'-kinase